MASSTSPIPSPLILIIKLTLADPPLRRSCIFCRTRKIRCSGGHICAACRERNLDCVYSPEARKGRPRRRGLPTSSASPHVKQSSPSGRAREPDYLHTLGDDLEQRFQAYFISNPGSQSNLFQNSIASFYRRARPTTTGPPRRLDYAGLLSWMSHEMVEMLLLRLGHLGCERPSEMTTATRDAFITALAADTSACMFESTPPQKNPLAALGTQRILQWVDLWFYTHPLSSLVSKTLLVSRIRDETVDEALLALLLGDACDFYRAQVPSSDDAMLLMAWRGLCIGHARRATCLVGYACRMVARLHERWQRDGRRDDERKLNGVTLSAVEQEILQNVYWVCLSTTTWAFLQIDQPFSLFVPDETPAFPCVDETSSALLRLDRASDHLSTLPAQVLALRQLWPLSQISSTVAHIYTLYLNAPPDAGQSSTTPPGKRDTFTSCTDCCNRAGTSQR
ncbi:Zn(II)2Cys6 transcription factor domain-containing protein [Aspergillus tanneri]|uniref:Zn(2)-C6 fungal-type domain-containing protein n=1 Tax=Aspergillus tanneri TaxID=1220188 RepID=A0A5M9MXN5_9EURO|nr:uncharacterized protein ATNIH1004_000529 [Aspergillus tanneri]KAA8651638.1 hypothetical protein ATNIH1004_000529 [Aspergillus tanneri]